MIDPTTIFWDTITGIIVKLPEFILIIWAVKTLVKQVPHWLTQWETSRMKIRTVDKAIESQGKWT